MGEEKRKSVCDRLGWKELQAEWIKPKANERQNRFWTLFKDLDLEQRDLNIYKPNFELDSKYNQIKFLGTFQIWKSGVWFKYSNLNQGL
jgi:hypothetical protein